MSFVNALRNHPLYLALGLTVLFGAWVAYDAAQPLRTLPASLDAPPVSEPTVVEIKTPPFEDSLTVVRGRDPFRPGVVTADLIPRLHLGMARVAVEELIGQPPAGLVQPVSMVDGKFIHRASYLANLDSGPAASAPAPRSIIGLEYDAGRPGHPLTRIHIPDPMS